MKNVGFPLHSLSYADWPPATSANFSCAKNRSKFYNYYVKNVNNDVSLNRNFISHYHYHHSSANIHYRNEK